MQPYVRRVVDDELDELMAGAAAIALEGPRGTGKTRTATERAATVLDLTDRATRVAVEADPAIVLAGSHPVLVDEWQLVPDTWDAIRTAVDRGAAPGSFLLAGSAVPKAQPAHPGTGRILAVRMRPMTLHERGIALPSVSLRALLSGSRPPLTGETAVRAADYAAETLASGLPGLRGLPARTVRAQLDSHLDRIIDRDYTELGGERLRNPVALRRWLASYAAALSSTASLETIRDAAAGAAGEIPGKSTVQRYLDVLERLWLIEPVPGWMPARPALARLTAAPKHQLADPAFAARLLGVGAGALVGADAQPPGVRHPDLLLGALFESLATLCVRVFAQAAEARVFHYRTHRGEREVDLIVERDDHRFVAIEVKSARAVADDDARHLRRLRVDSGDAMLDAIVLSAGPVAYRREDGIGVIPLALLGA
ncbi:MAG: AAA family ATPase [Chloroflexi bacterium RBG_16_72_14]|nr:MAG: AAA family ATPase [Chloroflexi bacterium RBG_16_72_14]